MKNCFLNTLALIYLTLCVLGCGVPLLLFPTPLSFLASVIWGIVSTFWVFGMIALIPLSFLLLMESQVRRKIFREFKETFRPDRFALVMGLIIAVLVVCSLDWGRDNYKNWLTLQDHGTPASAELIQARISRGRNSTQHWITYQYNGVTREDRIEGAYFRQIEKASTIDIRYLPENPAIFHVEHAKISDPRKTRLFAASCIAGFVIMAAIARE